MTTGTITPFLAEPEDINTPKPGYFYDMFHLIHAYLELLTHTNETAIPTKGLLKLYSYRMGVLNIDSSLLVYQYSTLVNSDRNQLVKLQNFGQSCIALNIQTLYMILAKTLTKDITRGFGDDRCLTAEVVIAINHFCSQQTRQQSARVQTEDNMISLVETCHFNATYSKGGIACSQAIMRIIDVLDTLVINQQPVPLNNSRRRLKDALRILFYIGCSYYHLNLLRFSDEITQRSYDRMLNINDYTLASVPFDPTMIRNCPDDTGSISKWGIEYLQALDSVLSYVGGIRYSTVSASDNQR